MKNYLIGLVILLLSSCSAPKTIIAENEFDVSNKGINKKQSELIFDYTKSFPNNTQLSIAIIKNGEINFVGIERINDKIKFIENYKNVFEIGSITKVFTATLLSNFVNQQKLRLDDNIQDYLDFKINTEKDITFKELANHTSGLTRMPSNFYTISNILNGITGFGENNPYKHYNEEKLIDYLKKDIELSQEPGIKYEYSNLGFGILGFELAYISNSSYESLLQEKIFIKYKMESSTINRENTRSELVKGLNPNGKTTENWDFGALAGAGAIFSTAEDLSKFALAQFDKENYELTLTQKPTYKIDDDKQIGLGWHILKMENGRELIFHNGGTGGYRSSMGLDIENKNGIIILSNVSAFNEISGNIDELLFELIQTLYETPTL